MTSGAQVGLDCFGPILNASTLTATDKASGYIFTVGIQKDGKKETVAHLQKMIDHYKMYNHHSP